MTGKSLPRVATLSLAKIRDRIAAKHRYVLEKSASTLLPVYLLLVVGSSPVAAAHDLPGCDPPSGFGPLFDLLHAITDLAFFGGIGLATLGFSVAGLMIIAPGPEYTRRGKMVAKNVLIGTLLLMSASLIVSFLVSQLGGVTCG